MIESKLKVATCSLCGCFGCHMSLLDLDERLFDLTERVEFDRSPLTDIKELGAVSYTHLTLPTNREV